MNSCDIFDLLPGFTLIPKQHPGQAHKIYIGTWKQHEQVAIKVPNHQPHLANPFYYGVSRLFGANLQNLYHQRNMTSILENHSPLPTPAVLGLYSWRTRVIRVHAFIQGKAAESFTQLSMYGAHQFGCHMATLHSVQLNSFGTYGNLQPKNSFHQSAANIASELLCRFDYDKSTRNAALPLIEQLKGLKPPTAMSPIMLDLDASQYFIDKGVFTYLIDTDFFAFAPAELELIALESLLPARLAPAFLQGYRKIRQFPQLETYRMPYRMLNRLLWVQGDLPVADWRDGPITFY